MNKTVFVVDDLEDWSSFYPAENLLSSHCYRAEDSCFYVEIEPCRYEGGRTSSSCV